jgi:CheY-like chemotaxis protein/HPt (histidine-containing phosphotransfer) domain-containing protein
MQMPGMDGLELAQAIKANPANEKTKLILMTSMAQRGHAVRSEQAGIAGYLNKPIRQSQLYDCLRTVTGPPSPDVPAAAAQAPPKLVTARSLKEAKDLRRPRVLLAEDNQTNQMAGVRILERLGYQVDVAVNGIEAVDACRAVDYDIVLMDNQMPEMDGLTAAREIRQFELEQGKARVPIIALTADAMLGDREKCIAAGCDDYMTKPFKVAQLSEMIERWGHRDESAGASVAAVTPALEGSAIDSTVFDTFREDGGGKAFVTELIDMYLEDSTSRMASLKNAVERRDAAALRLVTHSLKGSSSAVGAGAFAAMCGEMEALARNGTIEGTPALFASLEAEFARVRDALYLEQGRPEVLRS